MGNTFYFNWEVAMQEGIQSIMNPALVSVVSLFTLFGETTLIILILTSLYVTNKKSAKYMAVNLMVCCNITPMLKNVALRRRPYFDHPGISCLKAVDSSADLYDITAQGFSFPSGHSTNSVALFGSIARYFKKNWTTAIGFILPLIVGFSRVALGCHYITDVLCGWTVGLITIFLVPYLFEKLGKSKAYALLIVVCFIGFFYCKTNDYYDGFGMLCGFCFADLFEEKYVNFKETRKPLVAVVRVVLIIAVFFITNTVLKLPFSKEFLASGTMLAFAVRAIRYCLVVFLSMGVTPMCFGKLLKD